MKHQLILATMLALGAPAILAQSYFDDDIYYNPKKDKTATQTVKKKKQSKMQRLSNIVESMHRWQIWM